jgi:hypothetical protein
LEIVSKIWQKLRTTKKFGKNTLTLIFFNFFKCYKFRLQYFLAFCTSVTRPSLFLSKVATKKAEDLMTRIKSSFLSCPDFPASLELSNRRSRNVFKIH